MGCPCRRWWLNTRYHDTGPWRTFCSHLRLHCLELPCGHIYSVVPRTLSETCQLPALHPHPPFSSAFDLPGGSCLIRSLLLRHPEQLKHHCLLLCVPPTSLTGGKLHSGGGWVGETDSNRECLSFQHFLFCACITASTLQSQEFDSIVLFSKVSTHPEFWISKSEWHEIQLKKELLRKKHITKYVIVLVFHFTAVFVMVKKNNYQEILWKIKQSKAYCFSRLNEMILGFHNHRCRSANIGSLLKFDGHSSIGKCSI